MRRFEPLTATGLKAPLPVMVTIIDGHPYAVINNLEPAKLQGLFNTTVALVPIPEVEEDAPSV